MIQLNRPNIDYRSPEWMGLEEWAKEQLEETYKRLTGWALPEQEMRQLQGRASVFKQMLDFRTQTADYRPQQTKES